MWIRLNFFILCLISELYKLLVRVRIQLYDWKILSTYRSTVPVISVGNLTVGGSGKTPMVDFLVTLLEQQQQRVVIVSRGYGRKSKIAYDRFVYSESSHIILGKDYKKIIISGKSKNNLKFYEKTVQEIGDEAYLLAQKHPEVPVYVGKKRAISIGNATQRDQPDWIVLDDGYQHLAVARDLNLLLMDAERGIENQKLLPSGPFREPPSECCRADAVILTKSNWGNAPSIQAWLQKSHALTCPIFHLNIILINSDPLTDVRLFHCLVLWEKNSWFLWNRSTSGVFISVEKTRRTRDWRKNMEGSSSLHS